MVQRETVESLRSSAEDDLWTAKLVRDSDDEKTRIICFHLQQYVEKTIKAKLLENGVQYPKKHDLVSLLELFDDKALLDKHLEDAANLSDYATAFRYERRIPSVEEMESAFLSAQSIVEDIRSL
ncbi:MAG: HEPN domain-containing protein [Candidatus Methanomethylophilaceae archaeon]|nr:HEPN domain-containing protein [Candidatus Methanomethylophilaceae archaeon]